MRPEPYSRHVFLQFLIAISTLLLLASSCVSGTRTEQAGEHVTAENGSQVINVGFVTLRSKTGSSVPKKYFDGNRGLLRAGNCSVAFTDIPTLEEIAESFPIYIPDERINLRAVQETEVDTLVNDISLFAHRNNSNIVLYIHGYNIDFEKSCRRSAIFQRAIGLHERLILFSWPAEGSMLKYTWDEADLVWSVPHITVFLNTIIKDIGNNKIDIVGHSLGARGVVQALTQLALQSPGAPLVDELILIAPDIDIDIFKQQYPLFRQSVNRITLYLSENDRALKLSREVHGYPRLGEAGEYLTILPGIETIDISDITNKRMSGHLYHLFDSEVIMDLTLLLNSRKPARQRPFLEQSKKNGATYWRMLPKDE